MEQQRSSSQLLFGSFRKACRTSSRGRLFRLAHFSTNDLLAQQLGPVAHSISLEPCIIDHAFREAFQPQIDDGAGVLAGDAFDDWQRIALLNATANIPRFSM